MTKRPPAARPVDDLGDRRYAAQDLAYAAMEARTAGAALQLASQALLINPRCVDAIMLLVNESGLVGEARVKAIEAAVKAGEEDLGPAFFRENAGMFWGLIETRPYMRARAYLSQALESVGRQIEAADHLTAMIDLNPGDNQGLRYGLLNLQLVLDRLDDAKQLLKTYPEGSAFMAWGRVLHAFLTGGPRAAAEPLRDARNSNAAAEGYLTGRTKVPRVKPGFYSPGTDSEAILCVETIGPAWTAHPAATKWLKSLNGK